ncbi:MAG TPA: proton-conducting transporter membrane subunit, partial [Salinibacter sp.]|nr:proton-conducting transporter membrane subunit [Salinibacter sp.]
MALALLLTLLWAAAAPLLVRIAGRQAGWALALGPVGLFVWFLAYLPEATAGAGLREAVSWVPTLGVELSFLLDGLSLLFALLITGLGTLIVVYAGRYLDGHRDLGRFFVILFAFLASMLGVVLADNLLLLFVFWEGTSLCSYLLVGFKHESETARKAALQALLVTGGGGLALLTGILLLGTAGGSFELSTLLTRGADVQAHPLYLPAFVLIAIGAFAKSAQVPFHFWLPNAMAAPTPVSAYLHSATMVKAGVYLLARLDPVLGGTGAWIWTLAVVGGATMLVGAIGALRHTDLKKVLAYSTLTALGTLVVLLGLSYDASIKAAIVFLLVHALYKSGLFLVAGSVEHGTGTRDLLQVSGLRSVLPWTALAAVLAGLSMAGLPPLFGFVGKELAYKAKLGVENLDWLLPTIAVTANALTVVAAGMLVLRPFFGSRRTPEGRNGHEVPLAMWIGPLLVGAAGLLFGIAPGLMAELVAPAVAVVAGE